MKRNSILVLVVLGALCALGLAQTAAAHPYAGVPYHHFPNDHVFLQCLNYQGALSTNTIDVAQPDAVQSTSNQNEFVYYRALAARPDSRLASGWEITYGDWQRAVATPTGSLIAQSTTYGRSNWTSMNGFYPAIGNYLRVPYVAGAAYWIGYDIYWSTTGQTHRDWVDWRACG